MVLRHINEDFRLLKQFLHVLGAFCDTRKKLPSIKKKYHAAAGTSTGKQKPQSKQKRDRAIPSSRFCSSMNGWLRQIRARLD
jgi:hypothetical protein